ncbi:DUF1446 domain-containing protein [Pseudogracilibacillus auburnensis]|uniref:acyclic terpene utilization AtuA family protein n=1 Tax=Pseudogracilibacillus auburnensis TaxID=1494959 RepID=UPI002468085B|nr:DUF1446 domain-containing protein [Pseudogracilibacillus auburnensis]
MGKGLLGHLLECAGQVCGGYFADSNLKKVPNLKQLGFPYAIISPVGEGIITKVQDTGGLIDLRTVKEQLLYEVHNPREYITPDVVADFTTVQLEEIKENQILVKGGSGKERPHSLKVSVGYHAGYLGEGEISYAGTGALERAQLSKEILYERLSPHFDHLRVDIIGISSIHRKQFNESEPYEVRVRAAGRHRQKMYAERIGHEVESLYLNGPAAGGGARKHVTDSIGIISTLIARNKVKSKVEFLET